MKTSVPWYTYKNSKDIKIDDKNFIFKPQIEEWYKEVLKNPRAINNAIFFGHQAETGKTTLAELIAQKTQRPLFVCRGSEGNFLPNYNTEEEGEERFEKMVKEIETGFYTEDNGRKIKTEADKKGYILLFEKADMVEDKCFLGKITRRIDQNKNALFILVTRTESVGYLTFPYLYKSNLKELFFDFNFEFLKRNLEKLGEKLPNNLPKNFSLNGSYEWKLIDNFMFYDMKFFVNFWKRESIHQELTEKIDEINKNEVTSDYEKLKKVEEIFIDILERFWDHHSPILFETTLKEMRQNRKKEKEIEQLSSSLKSIKRVISSKNQLKEKEINIDEKEQELTQAKSHIIKINELNEEQQEELNNLLEIQIEFISNKTSFAEKQLERSKNKLLKIVTEKELSYLLKLQTELIESKWNNEQNLENLIEIARS